VPIGARDTAPPDPALADARPPFPGRSSRGVLPLPPGPGAARAWAPGVGAGPAAREPAPARALAVRPRAIPEVAGRERDAWPGPAAARASGFDVMPVERAARPLSPPRGAHGGGVLRHDPRADGHAGGTELRRPARGRSHSPPPGYGAPLRPPPRSAAPDFGARRDDGPRLPPPPAAWPREQAFDNPAEQRRSNGFAGRHEEPPRRVFRADGGYPGLPARPDTYPDAYTAMHPRDAPLARPAREPFPPREGYAQRPLHGEDPGGRYAPSEYAPRGAREAYPPRDARYDGADAEGYPGAWRGEPRAPDWCAPGDMPRGGGPRLARSEPQRGIGGYGDPGPDPDERRWPQLRSPLPPPPKRRRASPVREAARSPGRGYGDGFGRRAEALPPQGFDKRARVERAGRRAPRCPAAVALSVTCLDACWMSGMSHEKSVCAGCSQESWAA